MNVALKEWGVVVDAMLEGLTVLTLRKGGIIEPGPDGFTVAHRKFWFFPTVIHQRDEELAPALKHLAAPARARYQNISENIPFFAVGEVMAAWQVVDEAFLANLAPFSPLSLEGLLSRFHFGKTSGIWAVFLKVSETSKQYEEPYLQLHSGCKSWVDLPQSLDPGETTSTLSDHALERRLAGLSALLGPSQI